MGERAKAPAGNTDEEWYCDIYQLAFTVARRQFRFTTADAEDVAQEITLRTLKRRATQAVNHTWVYRGATYLCIDVQRSRDTERRALEAYARERRGTHDAAAADRARDVQLAVARLPDASQRLIRHYYDEGLTWREIDILLDRGRRCSQYETGKCIETLRQMFDVPADRNTDA